MTRLAHSKHESALRKNCTDFKARNANKPRFSFFLNNGLHAMQTGKSGEKSSFAPEKTGVCRCEGKAVHSSGRWPLALELALSTRVLSRKADFSSAQQKALEIEI